VSDATDDRGGLGDRRGTTSFSPTQTQRLRELGAGETQLVLRFDGRDERDAAFRHLEVELTRAGRGRLDALRAEARRPALSVLEETLGGRARELGFVQVATPTIIGRDALRRMGITAGHPLAEQVFWLQGERCLRPMLAPNLYTLWRRLARVWPLPFGLVEIGSCFRLDTKGSRHLNEFTMMNLAELGTPLEHRRERIRELAAAVMETAGVDDYELVAKESEVYGDTVDVLAGPGRLEVCSAAMGPHPLDDAWGIVDPWVGLGFGLERLLLAREGVTTIERLGRSLSYLDGVRLNL
jgi:pyrrolysyl-tRNA synthetase-like protein